MKSRRFRILPLITTAFLIAPLGCGKTDDHGRVIFGPRPGKKELAVDGPYISATKRTSVTEVVRRNGGHEVVKRYASRRDAFTCQSATVPDRSFEFRLAHSKIPPYRYPQPGKLFAVSDIEGNFYALEKLLVSAGVVDKNLKWSFGDGHLVCVGDFVDRGEDVIACLWLIYSLEAQAAEAGGRVHFLLGNHETMNLRGDFRYARPKYKALANVLDMQFKQLFSTRDVLGKWLRKKNTIEKIGDTLFVHGGVSPELLASELDADQINEAVRINTGLTRKDIYRKGGTPELVYGSSGPLWYRGYFKKDAATVETELDDVLMAFGVKRVVVGHSVVPQVQAMGGGRLIAIDVKHPHSSEDPPSQGLLIENGKLYRVNDQGGRERLD